MTVVNSNFLKKYIQNGVTHENHQQAVKSYYDIKMHADGESPGELLNERRPNESMDIWNYRKKIYQPKTKTVIGKVQNVLEKIRRSTDWSIRFTESPARIPEGESLEDYTEYKFPTYTSLTKWLFDVALKQHLVDPNAVALVHNYGDVPYIQNEYPKPVVTIFNSDRVIDYMPGEFALLKSDRTHRFIENSNEYDGEIYYVVEPNTTTKILQISTDKSKWKYDVIEHNCGELPCFFLGGRVKKEMLYESRISNMVPSLNVAVTIYSDKQAELVQHVHSEKWIFQTQKCKVCNGVGKVPMKNSAPMLCDSCKGAGVVETSPYSNIVINPASLPVGEKQYPIPPAGYIQKTDVAAMVDAISKEVKQEIFDAYSAVSMEFLMKEPMSESGIAKATDRDELNNFVYGFAEDLIATLDRSYRLIAIMRYNYQIAMEDINEMLPKIAVPEKFDLLSSNYYLEKFQAARTAKLSPLILSAMEIEFTAKEFYNDAILPKLMFCIDKLNPLPGMTEEEKMVIKSNGGTTAIDYIVSSNIVGFIKRAYDENKDFFDKPLKEQKTVIYGYADEVKKANAASVIDFEMKP